MANADVVWAVVVARVGSHAKSRLSAVLDVEGRRLLALAMLDDVLTLCATSRDLVHGTVAVVDDPEARALAEGLRVVAIDDPRPGEMNAAVSAGVEAALGRGASTVIVLPGDVPLIARGDIEALIGAAGLAERAVIVGASRDGQGTNALLLRPPDVMAPAFGPPSVERHLRLGLAAGADAHVVEGLGLALDVDTPADLRALSDRAVGGHTAAALAGLRRRLLASSRA